MATGSFVLFVDSDDLLADSNVLDRMYRALKITDSDILVGNFNEDVNLTGHSTYNCLLFFIFSNNIQLVNGV